MAQFKYVYLRETGMHRPCVLKRTEYSKRAFAIELSVHKIVDDRALRGVGKVNWMDIECVEGRYLLCGGSSAGLSIVDLDGQAELPTDPLSQRVGSRSTQRGMHNGIAVLPSVAQAHRSRPDEGSDERHLYSIETVQWMHGDTGLFLTSGMDHSLKVWDTNEMRVAFDFDLASKIFHHHASPLLKTLVATATEDPKVLICDMRTGSASHTLQGHNQPVLAVQWSPRDDQLLATGSRDNKILLWDVRNPRKVLASLDQFNGAGDSADSSTRAAHNGAVKGLCFTSDGLFLLSSGTDARLMLWDALSAKNTLVNFASTRSSTRTQMAVAALDCNPLLAFHPSANDVLCYEVHAGRKANVLRGHYHAVRACVLHPFRPELYTAGDDGKLLVWTPFGSSPTGHVETIAPAPPARNGAAPVEARAQGAPNPQVDGSRGAGAVSRQQSNDGDERIEALQDAWSDED
eukprot:Opistho-2@83903